MNENFVSNAKVATHHYGGINPPDNQQGKKTVQGISVIPPEQVSPLLALPNELLAKIARYLPFADFRSLDLT
ncbi:F-box protein, partial [Endozoicomonas sp. ONNA2]|uniref:F-box protein n=1 Tax=Endozoicomonas sp. ONNA2 TaxID=2828741 RepID=UPI0021492F49